MFDDTYIYMHVYVYMIVYIYNTCIYIYMIYGMMRKIMYSMMFVKETTFHREYLLQDNATGKMMVLRCDIDTGNNLH